MSQFISNSMLPSNINPFDVRWYSIKLGMYHDKKNGLSVIARTPPTEVPNEVDYIAKLYVRIHNEKVISE